MTDIQSFYSRLLVILCKIRMSDQRSIQSIESNVLFCTKAIHICRFCHCPEGVPGPHYNNSIHVYIVYNLHSYHHDHIHLYHILHKPIFLKIELNRFNTLTHYSFDNLDFRCAVTVICALCSDNQ